MSDKKVLIVDGHNVIFKSKELKGYSEAAIEKLVEILNSTAFLEYDEVIVVFDASEPVRTEYMAGRVQVILTRKGEIADTVISRILENLSAQSVTVVSDDYSVQLSAIHRSCLRMTTREFFIRYETGRQNLSEKNIAGKNRLENYLSAEEREILLNLYRKLVLKERNQE